jgi:dTDP-4-amino-4,6-dideoxygalactose transaminase
VNTDKLLDQVISLPMHTELDEEQLKYITDAVLEFMG